MRDKALHAIRSALLSNGWTDPANCDYEPTADAILAALKTAGIAVVELPEPNEDDRWSILAKNDLWVEGGETAQVMPKFSGAAIMLRTPEATRRGAAALLAAAEAAEAVTDE